MQTESYRAIIFDFYGVVCSHISRDWLIARGIPEEEGPPISKAYVYPADRNLLTTEQVYRGCWYHYVN
jgi:hypothetical protein